MFTGGLQKTFGRRFFVARFGIWIEATGLGPWLGLIWSALSPYPPFSWMQWAVFKALPVQSGVPSCHPDPGSCSAAFLCVGVVALKPLQSVVPNLCLRF